MKTLLKLRRAIIEQSKVCSWEQIEQLAKLYSKLELKINNHGNNKGI